jgi:trehalose-6-phosphate synthase
MSAKKKTDRAVAGNRSVDAGPKGGRSRQRSSLVVVSNRIPFSFARQDGRLVATPSSGGLIGALEPLLKAHGDLWVGSAGTEDTPEIRNQSEKATREHAYRYAPIFLTEEEHTNYYEGFSNEVLWPLLHDLQSRCVFDPVYWDFYQRVNRRFADVVVAETGKNDFIWIQDHQLLGGSVEDLSMHMLGTGDSADGRSPMIHYRHLSILAHDKGHCSENRQR